MTLLIQCILLETENPQKTFHFLRSILKINIGVISLIMYTRKIKYIKFNPYKNVSYNVPHRKKLSYFSFLFFLNQFKLQCA